MYEPKLGDIFRRTEDGVLFVVQECNTNEAWLESYEYGITKLFASEIDQNVKATFWQKVLNMTDLLPICHACGNLLHDGEC